MEAICFLMDGVTVELPHSQLRETSRGRTAPQKSRGQRRLPLFSTLPERIWLTNTKRLQVTIVTHTDHLRLILKTTSRGKN